MVRDHVDRRHLMPRDCVIAHYVYTSGEHFSLKFRRFPTREEWSNAAPFKNPTDLVEESVDWMVEREISGDFAFDCYFTSAGSLNHIQGPKRDYVGNLKSHRKVRFKGGKMKAAAWAAGVAPDDRNRVDIGDRKQGYFTQDPRLPHVDHPVRMLILWNRKEGKKPVKCLVTNRVSWEINRFLNVYHNPWTGMETFHRDDQRHPGMGDGRLHTPKGQTRPPYLVMLRHSLLMARMGQGRTRGWAHGVLMTIVQSCRALSREALS